VVVVVVLAGSVDVADALVVAAAVVDAADPESSLHAVSMARSNSAIPIRRMR
jgi:hypothetical protein